MTRKVTLPDERRLGLNESTGTVHLPYTTHAGALRVSTRRGVETLLEGRSPRVCAICWPKPKASK